MEMLNSQTTPNSLQTKESDVPIEWNVGNVLLDLYEVKDLLGEGGMGKVYKVHHKSWNVDLAVKSPKPEVIAQAGGQENFVREAETWVNLGLHQHIVSCYFVRTLGGIPRVFAEYVEGGSLHEWIRNRKLYEGGHGQGLMRVLDVAIQFAWGLHYAHEQGLVHQDIKPANVMMTPDGTVKVTDFGLAKARPMMGRVGKSSNAQSILVTSGGMTAEYCSPEQAVMHSLSRKTDMWSWGLSVLEMFTGRRTWHIGLEATEALKEYLSTNSKDKEILYLPVQLADLLRHCFQEEPSNRPGDMSKVAAELQWIYEKEVGQPYPRREPKPAESLAGSLNNRAVSLLELGMQAEAERAWEQALSVEPHHPETTYNQGLVLWRSARMTDETLVERMRQVIASQSGGWLPAYLLGQIHLERDDCKATLEVLANVEGADAMRDEIVLAVRTAKERLSESGGLEKTFEGHTEMGNSVKSVHLSKDGRYALSGSEGFSANLKLWDVASGRCLRIFEGAERHMYGVGSVCLSGDGRYALSGSKDKTIKLWDPASGRCLRTFEGHTHWVNSVCLSADGRYVLSGSGDPVTENSDNTLKLWDIKTGTCLRTFRGHQGIVNSVCLSADDRYAMSGSGDGTLKIWDVATGQCLRTFVGNTGIVLSVCLSQDGRLALSNGGNNTLMLWDVATGKCIRTFAGHTKTVTSVCIIRDGRHALSGSHDGTLKLWDLATGQCLHTFQGHTSIVVSVCLSGDGRHALSGSSDNTLKLWTLGKESITIAAPIMVSSIYRSEEAHHDRNVYEQALAQARTVLTGGDVLQAARGIRAARSQPGLKRAKEAMVDWMNLYLSLPRRRFSAGWESLTFKGHIHDVLSVCLSRDGRYALSGGIDGTLKLWDVATGQCLRTFDGQGHGVNSVCLSANGRYALSGSWDYTLKLWDVATGQCLRTFDGHKYHVLSVCLSTDARYALSGSDDTSIKLWDVASGRCLRTFEGNGHNMNSVCLSADGRYALSGGTDNTMKLWDVANGTRLRTFEGHTEDVKSVYLGVDGHHALSGSEDKTLKLWDVKNGRCLRTFKGHTHWVDSVCLSEDGRYALSGSVDETLRLWDVAKGRCLQVFEGHTDRIHSVCLSGDTRYALSGGGYNDQTLKLWILDWELEDRQLADWDKGATPYLEVFLTSRTPFVGVLPQDRQPSKAEIALALTRQGKPAWTEEEFQELLYTLGCAGYGWLKPAGVRKELERMAREWQGPPPLMNIASEDKGSWLSKLFGKGIK